MDKIKRFYQDLEYKNKFKKLRIKFYIVVTCFFTLFVFFWILFFNSVDLTEYPTYESEDTFSKINITYENLTTDQRIFFEKSFYQLNPNYLYTQPIITVTNNMSKYCKSCTGLNVGKEKVYILFRENEVALKTTICHELLHNFFRSFNEDSDKENPAHQIVYSLSRKLVCF